MTDKTGPFEEPIRIFSDLHLGGPGSHIDDIEQLRPLLKGAKTVIFNGDTYEERIPEVYDHSVKMLEELRALCNELEIRAVFVTGNHDPTISDVHYLDLCDGRFFVTHGDLLFSDITPWSREVDAIRDKISEIDDRYGSEPTYDLDLAISRLCELRSAIEAHPLPTARTNIFAKLIWAALEFWPPRRSLGVLSVWQVSPHLARDVLRRFRPDAECLIMGHTHRRQVALHHPRHYLNTGAFSSGLGKYMVEVLHDQLWIYKIRKRDGLWHPAKRRHFGE